MRIDWFTSDLHIGHVNMRTWRGLDDTHSMDENDDEIIDRFNDTVGYDDTVLIVGDIVMGKMADNLPKVERMHGRKFLIPGNHDRPWLGNPKRITQAHNWPSKYEAAGLTLLMPGLYSFDGIPGVVKVDHFPYEHGDRDVDRHFDESAWMPDDTGEWLIHGHVHHEWAQWGRQINVGVDAWGGFPVSPEVIAALMAAGERWVDAQDSWFPGLTRPTSL